MGVAGAIVCVGQDGKVRVESGLIRKEDWCNVSIREKDDNVDTATEVTPVQKPVHSEALTRRLTAHRTAAIHATMACPRRLRWRQS